MSERENRWEFTHTKERISRVALRLFSQKGFKGTTIKDIAREVGITEGAIYRHFRSKEDIIEHLVERITGEIRELIREEVLTKKDIRKQVDSLIEVLINYAFDNPDAFRFLTVYHILRENGRNGKLPGNIIIQLFREAYAGGKLAVSPEVALSLIIGSVERLFILWELGLLKMQREKLIEEVKEVIEKALFDVSDSMRTG
ncbi:MAG TPA: TetR/AcrR family transcriptional regulator [Aquifex aeolicus]|uniref:TetR/AcrR family transcriptional regulator n=1 Tax=Aquifex aeolicus TaxID=63363 RepID=A0A7C5Q393_AQUAO|nr:TetR/AcrR family transcriptional regulator [Aquifex aeolicus]